MEPLNVLIGPNGSGKSNLVEALALLRAITHDLDEHFRADDIDEWLWKGNKSPKQVNLEATIDYSMGGVLCHSLTLGKHGHRQFVTAERVEPSEIHSEDRRWFAYYRPPADKQAVLEISNANKKAAISDARHKPSAGEWSAPRMVARYRPGAIDFSEEFEPNQSLLFHYGIPEEPPLWYLKEKYQGIRLYRNWSFGPSSKIRLPSSAHDRADFLVEGGANLALVLSHFQGNEKRQLVIELKKLFNGIVDVRFSVAGGMVSLHLEEQGGREIPTARLSDGTLRYLCLLTILLHPEPPSLICIEEPELGLHPDLLPTLSDLLLDASKRTQLVITTHSDILVDALTERSESVVVCEKHDGETEMRRLDEASLKHWLKDYSLGDLWTSGELGGNRW